MDINLELYKCFYYVATTLSFSEASRQLFISQSAVSQGIKTLEKKLGRELFFRSTKKVSLTPEGEILFQHVKPALEMLSQGEAQLLEEDRLQGQLRIGASDTICRYFLIDYLKRYMQNSEKGSDDPMYQMAMTLLERNKMGDLDYKSISKLYELEDKFDEEYADIMRLFKEANVVQRNATNYYFSRRNPENGVWTRIEPSFCRL